MRGKISILSYLILTNFGPILPHICLFRFDSVDLLPFSVQSKHRNALFRYRSETTETKVLFRIVPKLVSVPVSVVSNRNYFRRTPYSGQLHALSWQYEYPIVLTVLSTFSAHWLSCSLVQYTECHAAFLSCLSLLGSPYPLSRKRVLLPPFGFKGGDTLTRGRGWGDPISTMRQTLWYSRFTLNPLLTTATKRGHLYILVHGQIYLPYDATPSRQKNAQQYLLHMLFDPATTVLFLSYFVLLSLFRPFSKLR
jgi:hypothetical protein